MSSRVTTSLQSGEVLTISTIEPLFITSHADPTQVSCMSKTSGSCVTTRTNRGTMIVISDRMTSVTIDNNQLRTTSSSKKSFWSLLFSTKPTKKDSSFETRDIKPKDFRGTVLYVPPTATVHVEGATSIAVSSKLSERVIVLDVRQD